MADIDDHVFDITPLLGGPTATKAAGDGAAGRPDGQ